MSKSEILYMKGMNMSDDSAGEEELDEDEDIWDDSKLNNAYDRALRMANVEVAKRLAMSTNSKNENEGSQSRTNKRAQSAKKESKQVKVHWKPGMPCRALYEDDGLEYEAFVLRVINDKEVIVRFLGYENSEIVPIHTLKPTLGKKERARQVEQAIQDKQDDGFESLQHETNNMDCLSEGTSVTSTEKSRKKVSKKKKQSKQTNGVNNEFRMPEMPSMPFTMPNLELYKNLGPSDLPMPPPPLLGACDGAKSEDQALSSMLLSWYMSGYYTGLYQGMKRTKNSRRN